MRRPSVLVRFRLWTRLVWPPLGYVIAALVLLAPFELSRIWVAAQWQFAGARPPVSIAEIVRDLCLCIVAASYAMYRVTAFHPVMRAEYWEWLSRTPWKWPRPLPFGPVHLVPQDLTVLGLLVSWQQWEPGLPRHCVALVFCWIYACGIARSAWVAGLCGWSYATVAALGLPLVLLDQPVACLLAVIPLLIVSFFALQATLAHFPWSSPRWYEDDGEEIPPGGRREPKPRLGWPWDQLAPIQPRVRVPLWHSVSISLLYGWWFWAVAIATISVIRAAAPNLQLDVKGFSQGMVRTLVAAGVSLVAMRLASFVVTGKSPLDTAGRLLTGRWLIPSYDQIFVAPLLVAVVWAVGFLAIVLIDNPAPWLTVAVTLSAMIFVSLSAGPSLDVWRLTGAQRMVPSIPQGGRTQDGPKQQEVSFVQLS